jgi:hypothetical protein
VSVGRALPAALEDPSANPDASPGKPIILALQAAAAPRPLFQSEIDGVSNCGPGVLNGLVEIRQCPGGFGTTYDGSRAVGTSDDPSNYYYWTVHGSFGNTPGSFTLAGVPVAVPAGAWNSSRITLYPRLPFYIGPATTVLTVTTPGGSASVAIGIMPSVYTRLVTQCTGAVAQMRLLHGKWPSPTAYPSSSNLSGWAQLTPQYRPALWDQLEWQGSHTAIISWVGTPSTNNSGVTTWPVNIYQCNADAKNTCQTYASQFQIRSVNNTATITVPFTSTVAAYNKGPAPLFYR